MSRGSLRGTVDRLHETGRLIPSEELSPSIPRGASREECVAAWFDLLGATDEILFARLRSQGLSESEIQSVYCGIYARWVEEHDRKVQQMLGRGMTSHGR